MKMPSTGWIGLFWVILACQSSHDHSHDLGSILTLPHVQLTAYSDSTELFVDFAPMVSQAQNQIRIHLSRIGSVFVPIEKAKVTATLQMAGESYTSASENAIVPGIYELEFIPTDTGNAQLEILVDAGSSVESFLFENLEIFSSKATASRSHVPTSHAIQINYRKEQAWTSGFSSVKAMASPFQEILHTTGTILSAPGDETVLIAKSSGTVIFVGSKTIVGSAINIGDRLFTISASDLTQANPEVIYLDAKSNYERAKADYERAQALYPDKIISEKDFLAARTAFEQAENAYRAVAKNYSSQGQGISSTASGYLKNILVAEGQYVEAGTPLAHISKNKRLLLQAQVSQKYFQKLPQITGANFRISGHEEVFSTIGMNGRVISYGKTTSPSSPFVPITFEIDNVGSIIPGVVVEVFLKCQTSGLSIVIPMEALMEEQGNFYVFVQTGGESFEKREIKPGGNDGISVVIKEGLEAGERIVNKGAYAIKLASAVGEVPGHGHDH